ncbi:MAG: threonine synthase [Chlamydiales bacterium]|jgi:threonine synthase
MKFTSTNKISPEVSLKDAIMQGMPEDKGLYMPKSIPVIQESFFQEIRSDSWERICETVAGAFFSGDVSRDVLKELIHEALNFEAPLVKISEGIHCLELFHGPTQAFKDFGARFMARLMGYYRKDDDEDLHILVATSGDTGSAVGHGFLGVKGIKVWILYPKGKVSLIQEKQLTTLGQNITALEIEGTFDDCQNLVKEAFTDSELRKQVLMTSANSINFARLLPQVFYYIHAFTQLEDRGIPMVFSVPSGNFGNLVAGLFAERLGLPVEHFVAATNINDAVPEYFKTGLFRPRPSVQTISNSMDVGNPSNFGRMLALFDNDLGAMQREIYGCSFTDEETRAAIVEVYQNNGYIMDTHGAVGYLGLKEYTKTLSHPVNGIFLGTAHPAKFLDEVQPLIQEPIEMPKSLQESMGKPKKSEVLPADYKSFRAFLLERSKSKV